MAREQFINFLESLKGNNIIEVHKLTNVEYLKHKGDQSRYTEYVGEFLFFVNTGVRPRNISFDEFLLYKPLCEDLVSRGSFKKEILDMFKQE